MNDSYPMPGEIWRIEPKSSSEWKTFVVTEIQDNGRVFVHVLFESSLGEQALRQRARGRPIDTWYNSSSFGFSWFKKVA